MYEGKTAADICIWIIYAHVKESTGFSVAMLFHKVTLQSILFIIFTYFTQYLQRSTTHDITLTPVVKDVQYIYKSLEHAEQEHTIYTLWLILNSLLLVQVTSRTSRLFLKGRTYQALDVWPLKLTNESLASISTHTCTVHSLLQLSALFPGPRIQCSIRPSMCRTDRRGQN